jgi:hypothetical protein
MGVPSLAKIDDTDIPEQMLINYRETEGWSDFSRGMYGV